MAISQNMQVDVQMTDELTLRNMAKGFNAKHRQIISGTLVRVAQAFLLGVKTSMPSLKLTR